MEIPGWRGVRTKTHTYVRAVEGPWMLFDNVADPYQQHNLVDKPKFAALQSELDAELNRWLEELGDEFLPVAEYCDRFRFLLAPGGHPVHFTEPGVHDPINERG